MQRIRLGHPSQMAPLALSIPNHYRGLEEFERCQNPCRPGQTDLGNSPWTTTGRAQEAVICLGPKHQVDVKGTCSWAWSAWRYIYGDSQASGNDFMKGKVLRLVASDFIILL